MFISSVFAFCATPTGFAALFCRGRAVPFLIGRYPGRREEPTITWFATMTTYFTFIVVIVIGHLRDFLGKVFRRSRYLEDVRPKDGYAPLFKSWENFYTRRLYHRIQVKKLRHAGDALSFRTTRWLRCKMSVDSI